MPKILFFLLLSLLLAPKVQGQATSPLPVIITPVNMPPGDSTHVLVQRDLSLSGLLSPQVPFSQFVPHQVSSARQVLLTPSGHFLKISAYDARSNLLIQEASLPLPVIPPSRVPYQTDSIARLFDSRHALIAEALSRATFVRDSLLAHPPKLPRSKPRARAIRSTYDSALTNAYNTTADLQDLINQNTTTRDSLISLLPQAEKTFLDSLHILRRFATHRISDQIHLWLTGTQGFASSRIAYVNKGQLRLVDADGYADHSLTDQSEVALSPSWHPSGTKIVYSSLTDEGTQIVEIDLIARTRQELSSVKRGLNLTPIYTKDGASIIFAHGNSLSTDLFITSFQSPLPPRRILPATFDRMSPVLHPNGSTLAFISPRAYQGTRFTPRLLTTDIYGALEASPIKTPPSQRSYRTSPDWSPDGRFLAYMQQAGDFQVWLLDTHTRIPRQLTANAEHEDPSFAPNSRHLLVASNKGGPKEIWILDILTNYSRQLTFTGSARLPAWSPALSPATAAVSRRR